MRYSIFEFEFEFEKKKRYFGNEEYVNINVSRAVTVANLNNII